MSFRALNVDQIIQLATDNNLDGIEWGGDIHVPHGDIDAARTVQTKMTNAGLSTSAYGSYYKLGNSDDNPAWSDVLATALALNTPMIRIWAGERNFCDYSLAEKTVLLRELDTICHEAKTHNISVGLEFHVNTLTSENAAIDYLFDNTEASNLTCFWQPLHTLNVDERLAGLKRLIKLGRLANIHVFHWIVNLPEYDRRPLNEGLPEWQQYIDCLRARNQELDGQKLDQQWLSLEFFRDDSVDQFVDDLKSLKALTQ